MKQAPQTEDFKAIVKIDHCWLSKICIKYPLIAEVITTYSDPENPEYMWEEVKLFTLRMFKTDEIKRIIEDIKRLQYICDIKILDYNITLIHLLTRVKKCPVYYILEKSMFSYSKEIITPNGNIVLRLKAKKRSQIDKILNKLERKTDDFTVSEVSKVKKEEELTLLQDRVIRMAWYLGYYDIPKKVTIKDMSKILGISPATLHEILQRAERKIIFSYISST